MTEVLLEARDLQKRFGGLLATDHLSLALRRGEIHALIGPNGAGKTTALAQLSGELAPDAGRIHHRGEDITALDMPGRARRGIARSFQITAVFEGLSALENVALAVQARAGHHFRLLRRAARDETRMAPARELLERVGLAGAAATPAATLAHGQRRQLEIAMALALRPEVLLLDEPMAGMGQAEGEALASLLESLRDEHAILLVEHDVHLVFRLADRVSVLVAGAVLASGPPAEVRADPAVQQAYLAEMSDGA
ncbi:ABC transporter ATP-binding protein [Sediminicurvatus halobius]|uniref:ABC transporter ATP-binding protein n=1 Tax=Sediminicurvatus halobius TaxID=2182432 RepID=A0A2U2MW89_9GAMM|nr:ABC transporter ATP-binding protein [Spiribacter halobius]PWG61056.1 ABC transporter ATP-binding protein [Spiribacter halobius]UEX76772.1 ABC transporter ATP-binding protein [Spiribacter halobius]